MLIPDLPAPAVTRDSTTIFAGLRLSGRPADGEFVRTENLSTDRYPLLAPRRPRAVAAALTDPGGLIEKDALGYVADGTLYFAGAPTPLTGLTAGKKQLVGMGAYICVFPDKKFYNTADSSDYGSMDAEFVLTGTVSLAPCRYDGSLYSTEPTSSDSAPENPENDALWLDTGSGAAPVLRQYSAALDTWAEVATPCTRVTLTSQGSVPALFAQYDGVSVAGLPLDELNGEKLIYALGGASGSAPESDYLVLSGVCPASADYEGVTVSVTADAGMAPKLPAAAVTSSIVNSGTVAAAATGQSRVRFRLDSTKFDFSDAPGASAASVTVNGTALAAPAYEYLSPVLTANSTKFDIVLTDTRGRRAALSRTVTAQSYAPPSITAVTAQRCDSAGAADESGKYVKLSASVVYSALGGANAVSLSAAWRYRGGSYGAETALTPDTAKLLGGALDPDKTLELRITATDGFGQSALRTESLAGRRWAMKLRPDGLGVGFGMSPQEGSALELPDGWRVLIGGRSAAEQAWPVGAVFWTPEATNPASLLGFGTWSRVNSALPAAWKRDE